MAVMELSGLVPIAGRWQFEAERAVYVARMKSLKRRMVSPLAA
jgi:hypothetical protein